MLRLVERADLRDAHEHRALDERRGPAPEGRDALVAQDPQGGVGRAPVVAALCGGQRRVVRAADERDLGGAREQRRAGARREAGRDALGGAHAAALGDGVAERLEEAEPRRRVEDLPQAAGPEAVVERTHAALGRRPRREREESGPLVARLRGRQVHAHGGRVEGVHDHPAEDAADPRRRELDGPRHPVRGGHVLLHVRDNYKDWTSC